MLLWERWRQAWKAHDMPAGNLARRLPIVQREADGNALLKVDVTDKDRPAERQ